MLDDFYKKLRMNKRLVRHLATHPDMLPSALRILTGAKRRARNEFDRGSPVAGPPITVILRVTHRCNQRCVQCGLWGEHGVLKQAALGPELTSAELVQLVSELAPWRSFISFFGGEPLLRDDLPCVVAHASSLGLLTTINSNGLLLAKRADDLVQAGLTYLKVSLDGPREINDEIRRADHAYDRTVGGLLELMRVRQARRCAVPIIQLCATITKQNQYDLIRIAELADWLGVDVLAILFGIFTTKRLVDETDQIFQRQFGIRAGYWRGFALDREGMDVVAIRRQIEEIKRRRWRFIYRQYPADTAAFDIGLHYNDPSRAHGRGRCIVPWFRMQVMPNGDVAMCEDTPDYVVGNIREHRVQDLWNNPLYQRFRRYILEHGVFPVCARCSALYEIPHYSNAIVEGSHA